MPALKTDADMPGNEVLHALADFGAVPRAELQAGADFGGAHGIGGIGKAKPGPAAEAHVAPPAAHPCTDGLPPFFPQCGRLVPGRSAGYKQKRRLVRKRALSYLFRFDQTVRKPERFGGPPHEQAPKL